MLFFLPGLFHGLYLFDLRLDVLRHILWLTLNTQFGAEGGILDFKLLLFVPEGLHLLRELLVVLLGELGGLLELLILGLVLREHANKLLLLFGLHFCLGLVRLDLLLEFLGLTVYLSGQGVLNIRLLPVLLAQLRSHELHFLGAFLPEVFVLALELGSLLLDQLVLLSRLGDILGHLTTDRLQMVVEVSVDFLTLGLLIILDLDVSLLELLVLSVVLPSDLLVLLADDVGLVASVLVFERLLVVELLINLCFNRGGIYLSQQGHQPVVEDIIDGIAALLE